MLTSINTERKAIGYVKLSSETPTEAPITELDATRPGFDMPSVSVIIPTLNEAKNLRYVLPYIPDWVHEVIIVDGRSTDNTVEVALSMRTDIRIVQEQKPGKGAALRAGFEAAEGDIIVMMD